jgi:hypothetical protein
MPRRWHLQKATKQQAGLCLAFVRPATVLQAVGIKPLEHRVSQDRIPGISDAKSQISKPVFEAQGLRTYSEA